MTALLSGELFAGVGGLGMAVDEVFGTTPGYFAEFDAAPSKVLAYRYPDVPNLGDVTAIDFRATPHTAVRCGGFPCQDVSLAGRRRGMKGGTRSGLWSEFARSIQEDRPDWVVIENVRGLLSADASCGDMEPCPLCVGDDPEHVLRALGAVLGDLADLGFDAEWTGIRAADVGAPHGRFRVFILAWPAAHTRDGSDDGERARAGSRIGNPGAALMLLPTPAAGLHDEESAESWEALRQRVLATGVNGNGMGMPLPIAVQLLPTPRTTDMNGPGPHGDGGIDLRTSVTLLPTPMTAYSHRDAEAWRDGRPAGNGSRRDLIGDLRIVAEEVIPAAQWGPYAAAVERWAATIGRPAPPPVRHDGRDGKPRLNPELPEWMMGWPAGWVTDPVIGLTRAEQLKCAGNGVVPQQAIAALREMLTRPGVPSIRLAVTA